MTPPTPLRQQVVLALREAISEGHFNPGDRLVERELCEQLAVSRPSLREALRELENDGIVTSLANRGVIVSVIGVRAAREIYEMRAQLEGLLAGRFARLASSAQIASLAAAVDRIEEAYAHKTDISGVKRAFYQVLIEGADHDLAASMLLGIQLRASQLRRMTLADPDRAPISIAQMRALLKAIKKRDPQAATQAAQHHVQSAGELALRLLERRESAATATQASARVVA